MKKKILAAAALASAVVLGVFTGCGNSGDIGRDAALEVALNDAGVSESDTTRLRVSEDRDDGRKVYEIRFDAAEKEYDYEIQASDGAIISSDIETIENNAGIQKDDTQILPAAGMLRGRRLLKIRRARIRAAQIPDRQQMWQSAGMRQYRSRWIGCPGPMHRM